MMIMCGGVGKKVKEYLFFRNTVELYEIRPLSIYNLPQKCGKYSLEINFF